MGSYISQEELEELTYRMTREGFIFGVIINSIFLTYIYYLYY
jgi:hypothetical protein